MPSVEPELLNAHIGIFDRGNLRRVDWLLVVLTLSLAAIGLVTMYSATYGSAQSMIPEEAQELSWTAAVREFFALFFGLLWGVLVLGLGVAIGGKIFERRGPEIVALTQTFD